MAKRNEHLIVIMLEPMPFGIEFEIWPLHITIVPWFPSNDQEKLNKILMQIANRHKPFIVSVGKLETWGKKDKYDVYLIDDPGELQRLHWDVFSTIEKNGFPVHQKDYLGEKYRPHITIRNDRQKNAYRPSSGEKLMIKNINLIKQVRLRKTGTMIKALAKEYQLG
jgi:2'-5' RNA ligase